MVTHVVAPATAVAVFVIAILVEVLTRLLHRVCAEFCTGEKVTQQKEENPLERQIAELRRKAAQLNTPATFTKMAKVQRKLLVLEKKLEVQREEEEEEERRAAVPGRRAQASARQSLLRMAAPHTVQIAFVGLLVYLQTPVAIVEGYTLTARHWGILCKLCLRVLSPF